MKNQNKIYILPIIFILIYFILIVFLILPTLNDIKIISGEILSDRENLIYINKQNEALDKFKKEYKNYKTDFQKIDKLFVDPKNNIDFIKFLEKTASDSIIDLDVNVASSGKKEFSGFQTSVFQINGKGNFLNIFKFIEKIEKGSYLIKVDNLAMVKSIGSSDINANFLIEVATNQ